MAMRQQAHGWRDDTLSELDQLLMNALLDPDLTQRQQRELASAGNSLLLGWKQVVVIFSESNPGYEFKDLGTEQIQTLKKVQHKIKLLERLSQ